MTTEFPFHRLTVTQTRVPNLLPADVTAIWRQRFLGATYREKLDEAPTVEIRFQNRDFFLLSNDSGGSIKGYDCIRPGTLFSLQFGYVDDPALGNVVRATPIWQFAIGGIKGIGIDQVTIKGIAPLGQRLGSSATPKVYQQTKISDVVRALAIAHGYEERNLIIQDTTYKVQNVIRFGDETILSFFYRLAEPLNYRVYESWDRDGKPVLHFHKPGYVPKAKIENTDGTIVDGSVSFLFVDPATRTSGSATSPNPSSEGPAYGTIDNGNFAPYEGLVINHNPAGSRYPRVLQLEPSRLVSFDFNINPQAIPASVSYGGIALPQGVAVLGAVSERDLDAIALANATEVGPSKTAPSKEGASGTGRSDSVNLQVGLDPLNPDQVIAKIHHRTGSQADDKANDEAKSVLEGVQGVIVTGSIGLVGDPKARSGAIWYFLGFGVLEGAYLLEEVVHEYSVSGGYQTKLSTTSDGLAVGSDQSRRPREDAIGLNAVIDPLSADGSIIRFKRSEGKS